MERRTGALRYIASSGGGDQRDFEFAKVHFTRFMPICSMGYRGFQVEPFHRRFHQWFSWHSFLWKWKTTGHILTWIPVPCTVLAIEKNFHLGAKRWGHDISRLHESWRHESLLCSVPYLYVCWLTQFCWQTWLISYLDFQCRHSFTKH